MQNLVVDVVGFSEKIIFIKRISLMNAVIKSVEHAFAF